MTSLHNIHTNSNVQPEPVVGFYCGVEGIMHEFPLSFRVEMAKFKWDVAGVIKQPRHERSFMLKFDSNALRLSISNLNTWKRQHSSCKFDLAYWENIYELTENEKIASLIFLLVLSVLITPLHVQYVNYWHFPKLGYSMKILPQYWNQYLAFGQMVGHKMLKINH